MNTESSKKTKQAFSTKLELKGLFFYIVFADGDYDLWLQSLSEMRK